MRRLAPHDAELVEADARQLYEQTRQADPNYRTWDEAAEHVRDVWRRIAANPYRDHRT